MSAAHTPGQRLSDKQRDFLEQVAASEMPTDNFPEGLPLYISHTFMQFKFNTEGERRRWLENLEKRGLISLRGHGGCFVRLTDAARAVIAKATGGAT